MVDVHVRIPAPPVLDVVQEIEERLLLRRTVVCPERLEHGSAIRFQRRFDNPEEVLKPPDSGAAVLPQRVPLEIEEDVSGAGRGKLRQRVPGDHAVADAVLFTVLDVADGSLRRAGVALHPGLILHPQQ